MTSIPEISASAVAALIGMNPYRTPHEVMYQVLQKNSAIKLRIRQLETQHSRIGREAMKRKLLEDREIRKIIYNGLEETKTNPDIRGIVNAAEAQIGVVAALRYSNIPDEFRGPILHEAASEIHKRRGLRNENEVLDNYEKETNQVVEERNTRMARKNYGEFILCGRIDGYVAKLNRIVDSKERTYYREAVPIYDEVQMRVYMDLLSADESELIERFPDRTVRKTVFPRDSNKWGAITAALRTAVDEIKEATQSEMKLMQIIESNTFTTNEPPPVKNAHPFEISIVYPVAKSTEDDV